MRGACRLAVPRVRGGEDGRRRRSSRCHSCPPEAPLSASTLPWERLPWLGWRIARLFELVLRSSSVADVHPPAAHCLHLELLGALQVRATQKWVTDSISVTHC